MKRRSELVFLTESKQADYFNRGSGEPSLVASYYIGRFPRELGVRKGRLDRTSPVLRVVLLPRTFPRSQAASRCAAAQDSFWVSLKA